MRKLLLFAALICAAPAWAENIKLQVFHTNDIHGWIMARPAAFNTENPQRLIGGAGALANALKRYSVPGARTLLFDAGDWFQGTPEGTFTRGKAMVDFFNALKYDAVTVGNHDFDFGQDNLQQLIAGLNMPVVGSNVLVAASGDRVPFLRPTIITEIAGVKVGIFALLTSSMQTLVFPKNFQGLAAADEIGWAKKTVAELKAQGADVVILLSHTGVSNENIKIRKDDKAIAAQVPGIDLIVGGHSHTALSDPVRDAANGTLIVQAGTGLTRVGRVILEIDPNTKKVVKSEGRLYDLWVDELGEDPAALKIVQGYQGEVGSRMDVVIGTSAVALGRERAKESSLGDWVTDCERKYTKTQIALQNSGGIRADLNMGPVTYREIFDIMPFDNKLVTLNMSGAQVRQVLEISVGGEHGVLQVSGLRFAYDPAAPSGQRVRDVAVGDKPLAEGGVYSVTTVDFMAVGGDGQSVFAQGADKAFMSDSMRDVLEWCAEQYSPLQAPTMGRIRRL
ncbi:MAG: bifunctional UDP-sugar hydrolase/5'-nucleotidase [candidate division NC10 bacterium]